MAVGLAIVIGLAMGAVDRVPGSGCLAEEAHAIAVGRDTQSNETTYRGTLAGCAIEWIVRDAEPAVVRQRSRCTTSLAQQVPLMHAVGEAFFLQDLHAGEVRTLFWGRLTPDETRGGPQEMGARLALAAFRSAGWDRVRGRPQDGDINGFVRRIANEAMIYPELKALFAGFARDLAFASAEKVLVMRADGLPFYDQLQPHGVRGIDKLPFDCLAWFAISDKHGDAPYGCRTREKIKAPATD